MSVLGATSPRLEELVAGSLTHSAIEVVHPALALDAGSRYLGVLERAAGGELDPFLLVVEGAVFDPTRAGAGAFSGLGGRGGQPITVEEWVGRLAPAATAVIAIGTCATWGGIPAAAGNVTGAMGLGPFLGEGFRSPSGLPLINVPGCPPNGDAFVEVLTYVLLHLEGQVPLDLDGLGRPRWLYSHETPVQRGGDRADAGVPVALAAPCPVPSRGWINHLGGCAAVGGTCNGCTRADFPDATLPLVARA